MTTDDARKPYDFIDSAAHWDHRGEEMRVLAEECRDPTARKILSRLATDCDKLAKRAEERGSRDQKS